MLRLLVHETYLYKWSHKHPVKASRVQMFNRLGSSDLEASSALVLLSEFGVFCL